MLAGMDSVRYRESCDRLPVCVYSTFPRASVAILPMSLGLLLLTAGILREKDSEGEKRTMDSSGGERSRASMAGSSHEARRRASK